MKIKPKLALSLAALLVWVVVMGRQSDFGPGFIPFVLGTGVVLLGLVGVLRWLKARGLLDSMAGMAVAIALTFAALAGLMHLLKTDEASLPGTTPAPAAYSSDAVPR